MFAKLKNKLGNDKKITILLTILFIFNILLFINLFGYMTVVKQVDLHIMHDVGTIISAIIILGSYQQDFRNLKRLLTDQYMRLHI